MLFLDSVSGAGPDYLFFSPRVGFEVCGIAFNGLLGIRAKLLSEP